MRLAIVSPWFGEELTGVAERTAWGTSHALAQRGHEIDVLTTCSRSSESSWYANAHKAGVSNHHGVVVCRFPVDRANSRRFTQIQRRLRKVPQSQLRAGCSPADDAEERAFLNENINSSALLDFINEYALKYDAFLFLSYQFGPILNGWRAVAHKAMLQPCLTDEPLAYLNAVAQMMRGSARLLFNSAGEFELAKRLYGPGIISRSVVVGSGVDWPQGACDETKAHGFTPEEERYVLCIAGRDSEQDVEVVRQGFRNCRDLASRECMKLVLAGPRRSSLHDETAGILDFGAVDETFERRLLSNCRALLEPSANAGYSRAMLQAWARGRPVIVNNECLATSADVRESRAGWAASPAHGFLEALSTLDRMDQTELEAIGRHGRAFAEKYASSDDVLKRYEDIVASLVIENGDTQPPELSVAHVIDEMRYGDGSSIVVESMAGQLNALGFESHIFAHHVDPQYASIVREFDEALVSSFDFVMAYKRDNAALPVKPNGERQAKALVFTGSLATSWSDREFAASWTLSECAQIRARTKGIVTARLAPPVESKRWNLAPDETLMAGLADGRTNILFVGDITAGNKQHDLLEVFGHYLTLDFNARLMLVGRYESDDAYANELLKRISRSGLSQRVIVPGLVSEPALAAFYRNAHVFCSLGEHVALGLQLIEAMWFDVPVCAMDAGAARERLGDAGILLNDATQPAIIAGLWHVLATDRALRESIIMGQRKRLAEVSAVRSGFAELFNANA